MQNKAFFILGALLILFAGIFIGTSISKLKKPGLPASKSVSKNDTTSGKYQNTFADGWKAAREKLRDSNFPGTFAEIKSISGRILKIDSDGFTMETSLLNPLDDESLKTRSVKVGDKAEIFRQRQMTEAELNELRASNADKLKVLEDKLSAEKDTMEKTSLQMQISMLKMPVYMQFKDEKIKLSDFKVGNQVLVEANENINEKTEFEALRIRTSGQATPLMPSSAIPPATGGILPSPAPGIPAK
jgi:hypothetical protein